MFIIGVSALYALLVFSPYIAGVWKQAPGTTFAGAVHYSLDYYYYLSYMAQGKLRWLTSMDINTPESTTRVFYHWFYVLSGRVFSVLGISNILGYQLLILGLTILLLFFSYRLIRMAVPSRSGSAIAYILFLTSNAWPYLNRTPNGWTLQSYWSWYNYGEPFTRFSSIPHHLLAQTVLVGTLLLLASSTRIPRSRFFTTWALFVLSGFLLASTQTPLVLVVLATVAVFWVKEGMNSEFFPALLLIGAGAVPYAAYLRTLLSHPPFSWIITWEATQQVHMTILKFFQVNGPVVLLGVVGLPLFVSARIRARQMIVVFTLISWGLFLSPIPSLIAVLNVRFLSVVPTLTMACAAAVLIEAFGKRFKPSFYNVIRVGITAIILACTIAPTVQQAVARATFQQWNAYYFLPNTVLDAYREAEKRIGPQETCLVIWPFHISFTGLTGRRAFIVNQYATIDYLIKERQVTDFFADATPMAQKLQILSSNGISCVVAYSFTKNLPASLTPIYTNSYMAIYRVAK